MEPSGMRDVDALAQLIKSERASRGWSQGDLAKRSGVSRKTISDIENGSLKRAPQLRTVHRLLGVFSMERLTLDKRSSQAAWEEIKRTTDYLGALLESGTANLGVACGILTMRVLGVLEEAQPVALLQLGEQVNSVIERARMHAHLHTEHGD